MSTRFTSSVAWANNNFSYRRPLMANCTSLTGSETNFPAMLKIDNSIFNWQSKVLSNGNDVYFYDDAGTLIPWTWESFDRASISWGHVRFPTLTAQARNADRVWMYYGYAGASIAGSAAGTFSNGYAERWGCSESSGNLIGSVAGLALVPTGTPTYGVPGKMGKAISLNGSTDWFSVTSSSLDLPGPLTISAWILGDSPMTAGDIPLCRGRSATDGWYVHLYATALQPRIVTVSENWAPAGLLATVPVGSWFHFALTYDPSASEAKGYVNGVQAGATATVSGAVKQNAARPFYAGVYDGPTSSYAWPGDLDEIAIASAARSAAWVLAEYLSGSNRLLDWGPEERRSA